MHLRRSRSLLRTLVSYVMKKLTGIGRERREHTIFLSLLKSVPGLEEKLMNADSEDEIYNIAALVSRDHVGMNLLPDWLTRPGSLSTVLRFRKALQVLDLTIRKA